jgi:hypothetical protein
MVLVLIFGHLRNKKLKIIKKLNQDLIFYFAKKNFSLEKNSFHVERDSKILDFSIIANNQKLNKKKY